MKELRRMVAQGEQGPAWQRLVALAAEASSYRELRTLGRTAQTLRASGGAPAGLEPVRVALVGGGTPDLLADPLLGALAARGIVADLHVGAYGDFPRELIDPDSELARFGARIAIVLNTPFDVLSHVPIDADLGKVQSLVDQECDALLRACESLHERSGAEVVLHNFPSASDSAVGSFATKLPGAATNFLRRLNLALGDRAPNYVHLVDAEGLAARIGADRWLDPRYWHHAKQPIGFDAVPAWARAVTAVVAARLGRGRKCAILDLDNTLWGGVVGDDGVEGIALGEGSAEGEAFKAFQDYLKQLQELGILLAVCSKNDESVALDAIARHPEMQLERGDFVAFKANWEPKSDNIRAIAAELDLGLDAFVFIDDNPAERDLVRRELPEVAVPELGDDPADFVATVARGHWFEKVAFTDDDKQRTDAYRRRGQATQARATATDLPSYLRSLEMRASVEPFDAVSLERITQLTNKTNQFNLTTRRATLAEMQARAEDPHSLTFSMRLRDRFGDHGLVSVFFGAIESQRLVVDGWLMSCRVLKRGVEEALFEVVLEEARARGIREIVGVYRPSGRNAMVADLYSGLGFERIEHAASPEDEERWQLEVASAVSREHFIEIRGASGG